MKALTLFTPFVAPKVLGCTDPLIEEAVLNACIEFASKSCIVRQVTNDAAVADLTEYDVDQPSMLRVNRIHDVFFKRTRLTPRAQHMITDAVAAYGESVAGKSAAAGLPCEWVSRDPAQATVSVYPAPALSEADAITIVASMVPTISATRVPDVLYDDYARDIAAGAVAELMLVPAQPWSNPVLAGVYRRQFDAAATAAAALSRTGLGTGSLRARPRSFV